MKRVQAVLIASVAYGAVGLATAMLSGAASSPGVAQVWRLTAWLLSFVIFAGHIAIARGGNKSRARAAMDVALAVALGALVVAFLGPVRSHWGDPQRIKVALLSVVLWPVLTGLPAFAVALFAGVVLDRRAAQRVKTMM